METRGGIPIADWEAKRADSAERKLKNLREDLEKRVAALEARPHGVSIKGVQKFVVGVLDMMAPTFKESASQQAEELVAPLRQEIETLTRRVVFLEGRASASRE